MKTLEQNTRTNPEWLVKLNNINSAEPEFQEKLGLMPEVVEFLLKAFSESKLSILLVIYLIMSLLFKGKLCSRNEKMASTISRY